MNAPARTGLKFALAAALATLTLLFLTGRIGSLWRKGDASATVWFYDQSEKRLYSLPNDFVPPHRGIGGKGDDGVRAVVVAFRSDQNDQRKRRIAYLETYSPELKQLMERVRSARAAHQKLTAPLPSRDSDFFQNNTLVKRPEDTGWSSSNSPEGQQITSEWRGWRGPDGQPPIVCVP